MTTDADVHRQRKLIARKHFEETHGRCSAIASQRTMTNLLADTNFQYDQLRKLRIQCTELLQINSRRPSRTGKPSLTKEQLETLLLTNLPGLQKGQMLEKLVKAFDLDCNGEVDFQEFCICLSKLCGNFEEQLEFLFTIWDVDGSGFMELWELSDALEDAQDDMTEIASYLSKMASSLSSLRGEQFMDVIRQRLEKDPLLLNFCWIGLPLLEPQTSLKLQDLLVEWRKLIGGALQLQDITKLAEELVKQPQVDDAAVNVVSSMVETCVLRSTPQTEAGTPKDDGAETRPAEGTVTEGPSSEQGKETPLGTAIRGAVAEFCGEYEDRIAFADKHFSTESFWTILAKQWLKGLGSSQADAKMEIEARCSIALTCISWKARAEEREGNSGDLSALIDRTKEFIQHWTARSSDMLEEMDSNGDGRISLEELKSYATLHREYFLVVMGVSGMDMPAEG